ncbi:MAG: ASKHA domain-containing protein [Nitrospinota bacterium]|nr:ASKHA domain-containing protein [Nitrospinota bacterium]
MEQHTLIFQPSGRRAKVAAGTTILNAARKMGVGIEAVCGDNLNCGKCKVVVMEGDFPKEGITSSLGHVSRMAEKDKKVVRELEEEIASATTEEARDKAKRKMDKLKKKHAELASEEMEENMRLACSTTIHGDVLVFVPESSRMSEGVVSKAAGKIDVELKPAVRKYYVQMEPPELSDPQGDFERVRDALEKEHGVKVETIDYRALQWLPDIIRHDDWKVTVTVWSGQEIIRVEPGKMELNLGMAIDIGTTTVAAYLTDLETGDVVGTESMMNPQVKYGEDVMSRITYCMLNPSTGLKELQDTIIEGLNRLVKNATEKLGYSQNDVSELTLVGNSTMSHILLGLNPEYMGAAPFAPVIHRSLDIKADRLGVEILPSGNVHIMPIEAGFVGADNVGCLIADQPHKRDEMTLLIDIGTNGELVFGNKNRLISCSTATGPALEGGEIEYGIRATPGAIEAIRVDPQTLEASFKVIGSDKWSDGKMDMQAKGVCGSGIIDGAAEMFKAGIIKRNGHFNQDLSSTRIREGKSKLMEYVVAWSHETAIEEDITINLKDVRAIQLAKGALYSGCQMMMRKLGVESFDRLAIAGAFGSHVDKEQAMVIGMYPDCDLGKVVFLGNAAGDGARIALLNMDKRAEADLIARQVEYVELALENDFNDRLTEAMLFPHMLDKFPHVEHLFFKEKSNK